MQDKLQLTLKPVCSPFKIPEVFIQINDFKCHLLLESTKTFEIPVTQRQNMLDIEFCNKKGTDTIMENGSVIADLAVEIESLKFRTFEFRPYINDIATYYTYNKELIKNTHGYMSFAGKISIPIESPLFMYAKNLALYKHFEENNE